MPASQPCGALLPLPSPLQEGFYEFNATTSVLADGMELINLNGVNQIVQVWRGQGEGCAGLGRGQIRMRGD